MLAIKANVDLCPWADAVYGCDAPWWVSRRGLPEFKGLRITYEARAADQFPGLHRTDIRRKEDRLLFDRAGEVGDGGNSGFQGLNLVAQWGAVRIIGIGFDYVGEHWYGRNNWAFANNPDESNFARWRRAMEGAAAELGRRGVDFVNCSKISTINNFRRASVERIMEEWRCR